MEAGGEGEPTEERIEGMRVPCWDAKRRVWQALELLEAERRMAGRSSGPTRVPLTPPTAEPSSEEATSP